MLYRKEITSVIINALFVKMLLSFPRSLIVNSGNSAWLQMLVNAAVVFLIFFATLKIYKKKKSIIEAAEEKGGKWLRITVGTVLFLVLTVNFLSVIRIFPETVKVVLLKETHINIIAVAFILAAGFGAYMGIESIARIHCIFIPIAAFVLILFLIMLSPYYNINNIMPFFGKGAEKVFVKGFDSMSMFSDIILLNLLIPHAQTLDDIKKSGMKAITAGTLSVAAVMTAYCLVYPYPVSENYVFPVYQLARMVHLSTFFSRFEAFFQFVWSILILLYSSLYIYVLCTVWQKTFSLNYYKPLIFPVSVICCSLSLLPDSLAGMIELEKIINASVFAIMYLLPLAAGLSGRKREKEN